MNALDTHPLATRTCTATALLWVSVWLLVLGAAPLRAAESPSQPEVAIESGRQGLARSPTIPWYDSETDDFRAAKVDPPPPPRNPGNSQGFYDVLMWLGWLLLAGLLGYLLYLLVQTFMQREVQGGVVVSRAHVGAEIARVEELPVALKRSPSDYLDEAHRLYRKGDYAGAIVYLFSHQLLRLDRHHWVRLVKGKTNRQYLREVRRGAAPSTGELADSFEATVLLFEEVYFGKRLPSREKIDAAWQQIDRFEAIVASVEELAA